MTSGGANNWIFLNSIIIIILLKMLILTVYPFCVFNVPGSETFKVLCYCEGLIIMTTNRSSTNQ